MTITGCIAYGHSYSRETGISSIKVFDYPSQSARLPKAVGTDGLARLINRRLALGVWPLQVV